MEIFQPFILTKPDLTIHQITYKLRKTILAITTGIFLFSFCLLTLANAQVVQLNPVLSGYVQEALQNNPDLKAWQNRVDAANAQIPQAGSWPDPMLTLSMANLPTNTFNFDQEPMTAAWIKVNQNIPLGGKPSAKSEIAESQYEAIQSGEENRKFSIAREIIQTWYDWAYWQEAVKTVDINIDLLEDLIAVVQQKYETGHGLQQDLLRAETERTRLEDRRVMLQQMALTTGRKLAILIGRQPDDIPDSPDGLKGNFSTIDYDSLLHNLLSNNPTLNSMKANVNTSKAKLSLAHRNWWPDLNLGVGYGYRQDSPAGMERPDFFTASAGFSIPLYGSRKQGRAVEEAKAVSRDTEEQLNSKELELRFMLEKLLDEDQRLKDQVKLYHDGVIPQAEATLDAATAEYTVGRVDFEALLMAETAVYNAQLDYFSRLRDRLKTRTDLSALVGDKNLLANRETNQP